MYSEEELKTLDSLAKRMGPKKAGIFLSVLGRDREFLNAINSALGQHIYADAVSSAENLIQEIIEEKDKVETRAELRAYLNIISKWNKKIENFYLKNEEFKKIVGGKK